MRGNRIVQLARAMFSPIPGTVSAVQTTSIEPTPEPVMSRQVKRALIRRAIKDDLSRRKRIALKIGENAAAITN